MGVAPRGGQRADSVDVLGSLDVSAGVIEEAVGANLLVRSEDVIGLVHPMLAAAVYDGAGGEGRRAAHRHLAGVFEDEVSRGRHLALGAAGPSESISAELEAASQIARDRGRSLTAADLAEHAARLTPVGAVVDRHRRSLAAARARLDAGDGERARAIVSELLDVTPAGPRRAEALLLAPDLEAPATAVALLEEALRAAGSEPRLRAVIHAKLAAAGRVISGRAWAERHVLASVRLASALGDDHLVAGAQSAMAMLQFDAADPRALETAERAYELAVGANDETLIKGAADRPSATSSPGPATRHAHGRGSQTSTTRGETATS